MPDIVEWFGSLSITSTVLLGIIAGSGLFLFEYGCGLLVKKIFHIEDENGEENASNKEKPKT